MRRMVVVAVAAVLLAGGCSVVQDLSATYCPASRKLLPQGAVDYIDFVQVGGITYQAGVGRVSGRALRDGDLGGQVAVVQCKLADHIVEDPAQRYLDGKVRWIGINDGSNRPVAALRDRQQVARLVELLLGSRVGKPTACADDGVFLAFHLDDGTATTLAYSVHFRRLDCRDPLPEAFGAAIRAALR